MDSLVSSHRQGLGPSEGLPAAFDEMEGRNETHMPQAGFETSTSQTSTTNTITSGSLVTGFCLSSGHLKVPQQNKNSNTAICGK
jgi:hypothetical protein